ncbi:MAG TPA: hypothetical protein VFO51_03525, partial [Sphingomicrobium sp.]|nr:hypothetical protein [Sphingomicrobium sp.]
ERLKGPDGKIDPERVNQLRTQFCANPQPGQGGQGGGQQGGPGQSGPIIIIQGPGGQGGPGGPGGGFGGGGGGGQGGPGGGFGGGGGGGFRGPGGGGGGGFFGGNSPDGRGRWFANLTYSYLLENEVLIAPGVPVLDLLDGDALQGALPRHTVQFTGGLFYGGFGLNANARYIGPSRIDGSGLPGSTTLYFGDLATFNLRLFADLNQRTGLIEKVPLLKNTRITLGINNVLDSRQVVVDDTGTVPLRYQPFLIDPVGRFVEIELRKLF